MLNEGFTRFSCDILRDEELWKTPAKIQIACFIIYAYTKTFKKRKQYKCGNSIVQDRLLCFWEAKQIWCWTEKILQVLSC